MTNELSRLERIFYLARHANTEFEFEGFSDYWEEELTSEHPDLDDAVDRAFAALDTYESTEFRPRAEEEPELYTEQFLASLTGDLAAPHTEQEMVAALLGMDEGKVAASLCAAKFFSVFRDELVSDIDAGMDKYYLFTRRIEREANSGMLDLTDGLSVNGTWVTDPSFDASDIENYGYEPGKTI